MTDTMTRSLMRGAAGVLLLAATSCGPYHPGANHFEDASTGSHLSGTDTGLSGDGLADTSVRNVAGGAPGGGR